DKQLVFYYEYYFPTKVETIVSGHNALNVYPTHAINDINVKVDWTDIQNSVIYVYDMQGRIAGKWQNDRSANVDRNIPVAHLQQGNYILKVIGENSQLTSRFIISR